MIEGVVHGVAIVATVAIAERGPQPGAEQAARQSGAAIAVAHRRAEQGADQRSGQNRLAVGVAETVRVVETVAGIIGVEPVMVAPVRAVTPMAVPVIPVPIVQVTRTAI